MHDIQDIMFAMEEEWNELENEAKQDFQSLRDEIKNKVIHAVPAKYVLFHHNNYVRFNPNIGVTKHY